MESMIDRRETTGSPAKFKTHADRSRIAVDSEDVAVVTVEVLDGEGRIVPTASNLAFQRAGPGKIIGVGNGDPSCGNLIKPNSGALSTVSAWRSFSHFEARDAIYTASYFSWNRVVIVRDTKRKRTLRPFVE